MSGLKAGWRRVRFDQMAINVKDRVDDPSTAGVEHYIGLEHLDSDSLKIRRWGSPDDVSATKLRFEPGDIIFGRRRVYQRKLGVAEFRGIASAHALVLRENSDVVAPGFLPFFMQSDLFMERAERISVGSLSPTINWRTLARQEFALPPLAEQRRLVGVLTRQTDQTNALRRLHQKVDKCMLSALVEGQRGEATDHAWHRRVGAYRADWPLVPIGKLVVSSQYGLSTAPKQTGEYPILRMMNLVDGRVDVDDLKYVDLEPKEADRYLLEEGDVLFNRTNSIDLVGRTGMVEEPGHQVFASYLVRLKTKRSQLLPGYLVAFLNGPVGRRQVLSYATRGVSQANVNARNLARVLVPLPPLPYQDDVLERLNELRSTRLAISRRLDRARFLATTLTERALGGTE